MPGDSRQFWSTGGRVIAFIEGFCVFSNGRWTGDPFVLEPWQKKLIWELFEIDQATGLRRFRRALIGIPRKNGKTELAAALALYLGIADNEKSAEVYCAASSEEQADRVFMACRRMCDDGNPLAEYIEVPDGKMADYLTVRRDPYSFIKRLTSKGKTKHGLNIHAAVLDEVHAWGVGEQEELWAALTTGMAAREQPMMLMITTAGADLETSRCGALYEYGRALERGEVEDDGFYFRWWQIPDDADWTLPEMWQLANPNWGVSVTEAFLRGELAGLNVGKDGNRKGALSEAEFRRLYGNQWIDFAEAPWVTREQLAVCRHPGFPLEAGRTTWVGVDLSRSIDSTAVAWGQQRDGEDRPCAHRGEPCLWVKGKVWERPRKPGGQFDLDWQVPLDEVRQFVRDLNTEYRVATNVFDPYGSVLMLQDLTAEGIPCELMFQQGQRRSQASSGTYDLIAQGRLHFDDPAIERHMMNAKIKQVGEEGYFLQKRKAGKVMDLAQAISQVVYGVIYEPGSSTTFEVYGI
jgi:phage terminase large subunit-like protein